MCTLLQLKTLQPVWLENPSIRTTKTRFYKPARLRSTPAKPLMCFRGLCSRHPPSDTKQSNMLGNIKDLKTADTYLSVGNQVQFRIVIRTWWPQIEPERISGLNCSRTLDHLLCVLIWVASRYHLTFTTKYIHSVLKTFLPLVTRPCRFDQTTQGKIKPRTEGFINHVPMAAILIFTLWKEQECKNPWGVGTLAGP